MNDRQPLGTYSVAVILCGTAIVTAILLLAHLLLRNYYGNVVPWITYDGWSESGPYARILGPIVIVLQVVLLFILFLLSVFAYVSPLVVSLFNKNNIPNKTSTAYWRDWTTLALLINFIAGVFTAGVSMDRSDRSDKQQAHNISRNKSALEASEFANAIAIAKGIEKQIYSQDGPNTQESTRHNPSGQGTSLHFPNHSLLVYYAASKQDWTEEAANIYHYACPNDWLASAGGDVKLVVIISLDHSEVTGHYTKINAPAYTYTYRMDFVDIQQGEIVAVRQVQTSDGLEHGTLGFRSRIPAGPPSLKDVVDAIREYKGVCQ